MSRSAAARCRRCGSSSIRSAQPLRRQHGGRARSDPGQPTPTGPRARSRATAAVPDLYRSSAGAAAADYRGLVVAWRNGAGVRLSDVARWPTASPTQAHAGPVQRQAGGHGAHHPQPGANIIETVDSVRAAARAAGPAAPDIRLQVASDRTNSIRASLHEIEMTLVISIVLVVLVVSAFLRSARRPSFPAVATVVSLLGTFGVMYLLGFSLNNLADGHHGGHRLRGRRRHRRAGEHPAPHRGGHGALQGGAPGRREVGFTVLSISLSLVAVFIPLLFMGGQVGRLFREFAVTLSAAVMISLVISLTTTPMMCAYLLKPGDAHKPPGQLARFFERGFALTQRAYEHSLDWALPPAAGWSVHPGGGGGLNVYLYKAAPKGFFPQPRTRPADGRHPRRPEHFLPGDAGKAAPRGRHHPARPGGGHRGRLHRRQRAPAAASCSSP
jgi:multidrug efflux pump